MPNIVVIHCIVATIVCHVIYSYCILFFKTVYDLCTGLPLGFFKPIYYDNMIDKTPTAVTRPSAQAPKRLRQQLDTPKRAMREVLVEEKPRPHSVKAEGSCRKGCMYLHVISGDCT